VHVHESASIRIAYLYAVCNAYILSKGAVTEVLEDRSGSARNELKISAGLEWLQSLTVRSAATECMSSVEVIQVNENNDF
jgi:hypothetical protein